MGLLVDSSVYLSNDNDNNTQMKTKRKILTSIRQVLGNLWIEAETGSSYFYSCNFW